MTWLTDSPALILIAILITCFLESFALLGLLIPGVVVLFSLTALAQHADIGLIPLLITGAIGGFIADICSFLIGARLQNNLHQWPWLKRHENWLNQGQWFIRKWGWLSVIIGRFLGPIRPVIPLVAGSLGMKKTLFVPLSGFTVLFWAPAYLLPGYYTGELTELWKIQPLSTRSLIMFLLTAVAISVSALAIYHHTHPHRWHLKGWLTAHQAERWPITATVILVCSLLAIAGVVLWWPDSLDTAFQRWPEFWQQSFAAPAWHIAHQLSTLEIALSCIAPGLLWLAIANQVRLAILFAFGAATLYLLSTLTGTFFSNETAAAGLVMTVFALVFFANLVNHRKAAHHKWRVYFITSQWIVILMTGRLWEGNLLLSETIQCVCIALIANALVRIAWQIWHLPQRIPSFTSMMGLISLFALSAALL